MDNFMNYDFNINKIVIACFVPGDGGTAVHQNRPSHGLAFNMSGKKLYVFSGGEELAVNANEIIYLPKGSDYHVVLKEKGDCFAINFDFDEDKSFSPFVTKPKNPFVVVGHFRNANKVWCQKKQSYITECKAELYNVISSMQRDYFTDYLPQSKYEIIAPAIERIHEKYLTESISIVSLAEMCGITPEYFRKIFKNFMGMSPVRYINNLRITRSRELLLTGLYSVGEVCFMSGFHDESRFSREFKKNTGVPPSEYK